MCRWHGGEAKQVRQAAEERRQEAAARSLLADMNIEPVTDPVAGIQEVAGEIRAFLAIARDQVAKLDRVDAVSEDGQEHVKAALTLYERALDRAEKVMVDMNRLGIEAKQAAAQAAAAVNWAALFPLLADHPALALSPAQKAVLSSAAADVLREHRAVLER